MNADWEEERLNALEELNILDTPPEERYDVIVERAAKELGMPIALITLIDDRRQWFKSKTGLAICETPSKGSFCIEAIRSRNITIVNDARADLRFKDSPLVTGSPWIRFYAGAPLILPNGYPMGTLCVIDTKPRELNLIEVSILTHLRDKVVEEMVRKAS